MGWPVDCVEDGDTFEECCERMCTRLDYHRAANAFCGFSGVVDFRYSTHDLSLVEK